MYTSNYHTGRRLQRGRGIGNVFGSIFRSLLPLGKKILTSNTSKAIAKSVGKSLKEVAVDTALDALEGKNIKEAAQQRLNESKQNIADTLRMRSRSKNLGKRKRSKLVKQKRQNKKGYYLLN